MPDSTSLSRALWFRWLRYQAVKYCSRIIFENIFSGDCAPTALATSNSALQKSSTVIFILLTNLIQILATWNSVPRISSLNEMKIGNEAKTLKQALWLNSWITNEIPVRYKYLVQVFHFYQCFLQCGYCQSIRAIN